MVNRPLPHEVELTATAVVDGAFKVHKALGPGLLESVYHTCLLHELRVRCLRVESEVAVPIVYGDVRLDGGLRIDMLVNDSVIVELKAVDVMNPVFEAQVLSYLKLTGRRLGLLINFNVPLIKKGIKRLIL